MAANQKVNTNIISAHGDLAYDRFAARSFLKRS